MNSTFFSTIFTSGRKLGGAFKMIDIPGCIAWYRSDQGITLSGGKVSSWEDFSGFGNHVSQSDGNRQPTFVSSNAKFNGSASITFEGFSGFNQTSTSDWLISTGSINGTAAQTGFSLVCISETKMFGNGNRTLFSVGDNDVFPAAVLLKGWEGRSEHDQMQFNLRNTTGNASIIMDNDEPYGDGTPRLFVATYPKTTNGQLRIWMDGLEGTKQVGSQPKTISDAFIKGKLVINNVPSTNIASSGSYVELAAFNRQLSTSDINKIQQWVSSAYHISQSFL